MGADGTEKLFAELRALREDVAFIKAHMVDADTILTHEEATRLDAAMREFHARKTVPLATLKKQLGL